MKATSILAMGLAIAMPAFTQAPPAPPSGGSEAPPPLAYDLSKETTLQGTVTEVNTGGDGRMRMVTLTFQADSTSWKVMAGPEGLLNRQNIAFVAGDSLTILGVPMEGPEGQGFLARRITKGSVVLNLLDAQGRPAMGAR
jgi:hypothetical protein